MVVLFVPQHVAPELVIMTSARVSAGVLVSASVPAEYDEVEVTR